MHIRFAVVLLTAVCCLLLGEGSRPASATAPVNAESDWFFVVVETHVHQKAFETSDEHPEERRWYISNVVALPDNIPDYSAKKKAGEYFDANIVEPAKARGILVDYYDQDMEINGGSVIKVESREQAEEMRKQEIADRKEQGGNIYSFELVFGPAKGEATSKPKLIFRNKEQPNYESATSGKPGGG